MLTAAANLEAEAKPSPSSAAPGRRHSIGHVALLVLLLTGTAAGLVLAQSLDSHNGGQALYERHCLECHGPTGKGDGPKAPFLSPRPGNLVSAGTSAKTDRELLRTIAQGKSRTSMPPLEGVLSAEEQQAVLQYIRSLVRFSRPGTPPPPSP